MQYGCNSAGIKVEPSPGGRATCSLCGSTLIAKCGDIYVWHWQHQNDRNCDPWKEHETPWHREWKSKFPKKCREVVIEGQGEKHIADVLTETGVVIEFQNSPISTGTIQVRENFYEDMVWVINARRFNENLSLASIVKRHLRELEREMDERKSYSSFEFNEDIKRSNDEVARLNRQIQAEDQSLTYYTSELEKVRIRSESIDESSREIFRSLQNDQSLGSYDSIVSPIRSGVGTNYYNHKGMVKSLNYQIRQKEDLLKKINEINEFGFEGKLYKEVTYEALSLKNYSRSVAILKKERDSIFPVAHRFKSETDFLTYKYKQDLYEFAIDPEPEIVKTTAELSSLQQQLADALDNEPDYIKLISNALQKAIEDKIAELEEKIEGIKGRLASYNKDLNRCQTQCKNLEEERDQEIERIEAEAATEIKQRRFKIMHEKKGLYELSWKHERKSWRSAECPVYFDLGDEHLYKRLNSWQLRRISKEDFVSKYQLQP